MMVNLQLLFVNTTKDRKNRYYLHETSQRAYREGKLILDAHVFEFILRIQLQCLNCYVKVEKLNLPGKKKAQNFIWKSKTLVCNFFG